MPIRSSLFGVRLAAVRTEQRSVAQGTIENGSTQEVEWTKEVAGTKKIDDAEIDNDPEIDGP
jgi:hypothetical protein